MKNIGARGERDVVGRRAIAERELERSAGERTVDLRAPLGRASQHDARDATALAEQEISQQHRQSANTQERAGKLTGTEIEDDDRRAWLGAYRIRRGRDGRGH